MFAPCNVLKLCETLSDVYEIFYECLYERDGGLLSWVTHEMAGIVT